MRKSVLWIPALLASLAVASVAQANGGTSPGGTGGAGGRHGQGGGGAHHAVRHRIIQKFRQLDTDKDHKISAQEAAADPRVASHFAQIDKNGDGFVTLDEVRAAIQQRHGRGHGGRHGGGSGGGSAGGNTGSGSSSGTGSSTPNP